VAGEPRRKPISTERFDQRMQALRLRMVEGRSLREISEQLGFSEKTIGTWLRDVPRARIPLPPR
jgi:DNA-directed RNA polymerase specialized sigma24 family protein